MKALCRGPRVKCLTVVDDFMKEAVDIVVGHGISGLSVARASDRDRTVHRVLVVERKAVRTDPEPEFTSRALDPWAYASGVTLKLPEAGTPTRKANIESFNDAFHDDG